MRAVARFDDPARHREPVGSAVAVGRDVVVDPARVGEPVRAQVAVTGDHERLTDPALVHDPQAVGELDRGELVGAGVVVGELPPERVERAADVMVHVEHVELSQRRLLTDGERYISDAIRLSIRAGSPWRHQSGSIIGP